MERTPDHVLDVVGLKCPMPVLKTKIQFKTMKEGEVLEVISNDPGSQKDLPAWADKTGNKVLGSTSNGDGVFHFLIEKPVAAADTVEREPDLRAAPGESKRRSMMLVVSKGTLDMAYPPLILASTAASMDVDVKIFFTFYGLDIIHRRKLNKLKVPSLANPAMPISVPNMIGALPGMTAVATMAMKSMMKKGNVPDIAEMVKTASEMGVQFLACQMSMDVMGVEREDLIEEVNETVGAAAFVADALDADISMFI